MQSDTDILVHTNSSRADLIFSLFRIFDNKNTQELDNHIEYGRYVSQSCSNNRLSQRNTPLSFKKRVRLESGHVLQNSFPRNVSHNGSNNNLQHPADSIFKSQIISPLINIEEVNAKSKKVEHLSGNVDKPNNNRSKGKNLNILRDQLFKSENGNKPCKKKNLENEAGEKICTRRKRKLNEKIEEESKNKKKKMKILVRNEQTKVSTKIVLQDRKIRKDCDLPAPSSKRSKKNKLNVNKDVDKPKSLDRDEKPMTASQKKKDYLLS